MALGDMGCSVRLTTRLRLHARVFQSTFVAHPTPLPNIQGFAELLLSNLRGLPEKQDPTVPDAPKHWPSQRRRAQVAEDHGLSGKSFILLPKRVTEI